MHVLHFTDVIKPHNWYLHPSSATLASGPARLSFVGQQGDMFHKWTSLADEYACERNGWIGCNRTTLDLRGRQCRAVAPHYARAAAAADQFSVIISHAPFRNRLRVLIKIEDMLQQIPEVHTIFLVVHGDKPSALRQSGSKALVEVHPAFDALGNRFGPLAVETDGVLIMDDDILLDPRDIRHAFATWQQTPTQLVGTFMRSIHHDGSRYLYRSVKASKDGMRRQNVALTKLMFVHRTLKARTRARQSHRRDP